MLKISAALDLSFKNLLEYGNLHFTRRQLYYEVCRAIKQPKGLELKTSAAVLAASLPLPLGLMLQRRRGLATGSFVASIILAGGLALLRRSRHVLEPPISFDDFGNALDKYRQRRPRCSNLLDEQITAQNVLLNSCPPDLPRYGLPRLLICESSQIAQMLRCNNFHLEASCAILDLKEASAPLLGEIYHQMLARAAEPRVYFLHDAALAAYWLAASLRKRFALPESAQLQILGLRPAHAERLNLFVQQDDPIQSKIRVSETLEPLTFLSTDEKRWLRAGKRAEVAAVHPVRLLRVLRRLILDLPAPQDAWKITLPPRDQGFM